MRTFNLTLGLFVAFSAYLAAQSRNRTTPAQAGPQIQALRAEVAALKDRVTKLESQVGALEKFQDEFPSRDAVLATDERLGYTPVVSIKNRWPFVVSLASVDPYLDGYKVTFNVGNPNNVTFNGYKLHVVCTEAMGTGGAVRDVSLPSPLYPGTWATAEVFLTPIRQLGRLIVVSIDVDQIALRTLP
jgi:hypothetical protein